MTRSDHRDGVPALGHPALVRGVVKKHEQHPDTGRWVMSVKLQGGRIVRGVAPMMLTASTTGGHLPPLPSVGTAVLVGFVESDLTIEPYVLGCIDGQPSGVERADPYESVNLHRSGLGQATSPDGTLTTRFPGGDELTAGPGAGYDFVMRDPAGQRVRPKVPQRALRIVGDFTRGGLLLGARLVGGLEVVADAAKREIRLALSERDRIRIRPGQIEFTTESLKIGLGGESTDPAPVARWPETAATLKALAREVQEIKHRTVKLEAHRVRHEAQIQITVALGPLAYLLPLVNAVPWIPLPFVTLSGKDGALIPGVGGVQVTDASSRALQVD